MKKLNLALLAIIVLVASAKADPDFSNAKWTNIGVITGDIYAMAGDAQGNLYVGGEWLYGLNTNAMSIAKWDGHNWSPLGSANPNLITAIAISGTNLYAAGSVPISIAKWDGSNWSVLGSGVSGGLAYAITIVETNVYAGGDFTSPGQGIAKWDGNIWATFGSGLPAYTSESVYALAVIGNIVYAGGYFKEAGGYSIPKMAKWDGSNWSALGAGINDSIYTAVYSLAVLGSNLYVAGSYFSVATSDGGQAAGIAQWDGSKWSSLGSGLNGGGNTVSDIIVSGNNLYVSGSFTVAGGVATPNGLAKWDGKNWSAIGAGSGIKYAGKMAIINGVMYVNGEDADGNVFLAMTVSTDSSSSSIAIDSFHFSNDGFNFNITGPSGTNVVIEASTNLQDWISLATNTLASGSNYFNDPTWTNNSCRYYRAHTQ